MSKPQALSENDIDLSDSFVATGELGLSVVPLPSGNVSSAGDSEDDKVSVGDVSMAREQLVCEQGMDPELSLFFESTVSAEEIVSVPLGYFIKDKVLMCKWRPLSTLPEDVWSVVMQVVVPLKYRRDILRLAHDHQLASHLVVNKTYDRVLRHFFWPGLKKDVVQYCKSCHVCQVVGKPNQTVPPAPLYPIPAIGEPFEQVVVDCVGPLPRSKSGNKFLLTIMCVATRFPEVIPLRNITAPAVVKALIKYFSVFGLPKVIQTDKGSNFMSQVFAQVLKQLAITHVYSSAYHPESQGAFERFHQTLKFMLRAYCLEFEKDWDDGVHLMMFAAREVVQESLGFSPSELVFAHSVRGPLKLLKEKWLDEAEPQNLLDYVCGFRFKLRRACELAKEHLSAAQKKTKGWYDGRAESSPKAERVFAPGDKVLVLLPIPGSSLQARFSGPYFVQKKVTMSVWLGLVQAV